MYFYKPLKGVLADVIPFYNKKDNMYYLFYLHDYRDTETIGCDWDLLRTNDFIVYENLGIVLPRGSSEDRDLFMFTGSIIEHENIYYAFYTGYNPFMINKNEPPQVILRAKSVDLIHWKKDENFIFIAKAPYSSIDWRDPFIWYDEKINKYVMLLASCKTGLSNEFLTGVTVSCISNDLTNWTQCQDFWAPNMFLTHECPDLFRIGEWWYMIYSEYTEAHLTRYIMSKNLKNWVIPQNDCFNGSMFYAAKSATDGEKRFLFGWIPTFEGDINGNTMQWGGNLSVQEIYQENDGTLATKIPQNIVNSFSKLVKLDDIIINAIGKQKLVKSIIKSNKVFVDFYIENDYNKGKFGITLTSEDNNRYAFSFIENSAMIIFEKIPNPNITAKYPNCSIKLKRSKRNIHVQLIYCDEIATICIDNNNILSSRICSKEITIGFFALNSRIRISKISYS